MDDHGASSGRPSGVVRENFMAKPVLVAIDDDPNSLTLLEAELARGVRGGLRGGLRGIRRPR